MVDWNQSRKGGNAMKRQLKFRFENGNYVIKEGDSIVFSIDAKTLKFISLDFYNGIYKDKSAAIELVQDIDSSDSKMGNYIFNWINEIIISIQSELKEPELEDIEIVVCRKIVPLFELSACAGDGFYSEGPSKAEGEVESPFADADYAVKISGKSMQPTIMDKSTVFVEATEVLSDGDIGIFVVDGEVMCKRFREDGERVWLQPDNSSEFDYIELNDHIDCRTQGKVLLQV